MKTGLLITFVVVLLALTVDVGDASWWGKVGRWFGRAAKSVGRVVAQNAGTIAKIGMNFLGKDTHSQLCKLKLNDMEAYDKVMQHVSTDLRIKYPEEDVRDVMFLLDVIAGMQPGRLYDELEILKEDHDDRSDDAELLEADILNDIADTVNEALSRQNSEI